MRLQYLSNFAISACIALLSLVPAMAQEIAVDAISPVTLSDETEWAADINLENADILKIISITPLPEGIDALRGLAGHTHEEQALIATLYFGTDDLSGEGYAQYQSLIQELRVPTPLAEAILAEAIANGASARHQRGVQGFLDQLRANGSLPEAKVSYLESWAPDSVSRIPVVVRLALSVERLADAQGRLADAQGRLADEQGRLVDVQGRLAAEEELLADAQEGLRNQIRATEALRRAVEFAEGL